MQGGERQLRLPKYQFKYSIMKKSFLNPQTHIGLQPIRVLKFNILHQVENTHPTFMAEYNALLKKHGLKSCINYDYTEGPLYNPEHPDNPLTPFVDGNKEITIQETFLSYLWAMCYSLMVIHEEFVHKPMLNRLTGSRHQIDNVSLDAAYKLHKYGLSLIESYMPWDKQNLPNPEEYTEAEAFYIERANGLFRVAAGFIICHELGHIKCGHLDDIDNCVPKADPVMEEIQADHDAFFTMIRGATDEKWKINYGAGMLIGFCSILLLNSKLQSQRHPDSDDRIETVLRQLELDDVSPLWGIASLAFKLWDDHYEKKLVWPKEAEHFKAIFYQIHEQLKAYKLP